MNMYNEPVESIEQDGNPEEDETKIPWHFWIFVALAGIYLVYRLIQMIILLIRNIF